LRRGSLLKSVILENVCFDLTAGVDSSSSDTLPLVFVTGYKVRYVAGASAVPLKLQPLYASWQQEWLHWPRSNELMPISGIAVCYKSNSARFVVLPPKVNPDGSMPYPPRYEPNAIIPNFVPPDFDPKGKTYRQLTPDGLLP
jgi:hypothetical protein